MGDLPHPPKLRNQQELSEPNSKAEGIKMTNNKNKVNKQVNPTNHPLNDENMITEYYKNFDQGKGTGSKNIVGNILMTRVGAFLRAFSISIPRPSHNAEIEDVIQDVSLTVVRSAEKRESRWAHNKSRLTTWLASIYMHKTVDSIRKVERHQARKDRLREHLENQSLNSNQDPPINDLIAGETFERMLHEIQNARINERTKNRLEFVFKCLTVEHLSVKEISIKGDIKLGQVYRYKRKIIEILAGFNPN